MLNTIFRIYVNLFYLVPLKVRKFQQDHPGVHVLAAGATKARKMKTDSQPEYEMGWATARRSTLILATDGLHCGDWFIPLDNIESAKLHRISGGQLLKVNSKDEAFYQFGLQVDPVWETQTLLPMQVEHVALAFSPFSLVIRLILAIFLAWLMIRDYIDQQFSLVTVLYLIAIVWLSWQIATTYWSKLRR